MRSEIHIHLGRADETVSVQRVALTARHYLTIRCEGEEGAGVEFHGVRLRIETPGRRPSLQFRESAMTTPKPNERVWTSIRARRVSEYHSHMESCPQCLADRYCPEGWDLAEAIPVGASEEIK